MVCEKGSVWAMRYVRHLIVMFRAMSCADVFSTKRFSLPHRFGM